MARKSKYDVVVDEVLDKCRSRKKVTRLIIKNMIKKSMLQRGYFSDKDLNDEALLSSLASKVMIIIDEDY